MDRKLVNIAASQIGFYDNLIKPIITLAQTILNSSVFGQGVENFESNKKKWADLIDEYEERRIYDD